MALLRYLLEEVDNYMNHMNADYLNQIFLMQMHRYDVSNLIRPKLNFAFYGIKSLGNMD